MKVVPKKDQEEDFMSACDINQKTESTCLIHRIHYTIHQDVK